jgi:hypothetical protein
LPSEVALRFAGAVRQIEPPEGPGAWSLQVISRGGLGGGGTGDRAISSRGGLTLFDTGATDAVPPDRLRLLGQSVRTSAPFQWSAGSKPSVCSDCVTTLLVLSIREEAGTVKTYTAFWDPTTRANVSADVLRIYELAATVKAN